MESFSSKVFILEGLKPVVVFTGEIPDDTATTQPSALTSTYLQ